MGAMLGSRKRTFPNVSDHSQQLISRILSSGLVIWVRSAFLLCPSPSAGSLAEYRTRQILLLMPAGFLWTLTLFRIRSESRNALCAPADVKEKHWMSRALSKPNTRWSSRFHSGSSSRKMDPCFLFYGIGSVNTKSLQLPEEFRSTIYFSLSLTCC